MISNANLSFDATSDDWTLTFADTFEYNTLNQVSKRITAGYVYIDGSLYFQPYRNESYSYTNSGQLLEMIIRSWENNTWFDRSKTTITYSAGGNAEVGYQYAIDNGSWSTTPYYKYIFEFATAIPQIQQRSKKATIYPNPASNQLMIESINELTDLTLFDMSGKSCYQKTINGNHQIDLSSFENGLYFLILSKGGEHYKQKILIQH
jgi:hypothetical protein